jgi:putative ABC transport system substrate-binding protein
VIRDTTRGPGIAQFAVIQTVAPSLGVELTAINALDVREIERSVTAFARSANGGLVVTSGGTGYLRGVIIPLAARLRLPAVYPYRYYTTDGGLVSYGPNPSDQHSAQLPTSIAFSRARSRPTCQFKRRPNTN